MVLMGAPKKRFRLTQDEWDEIMEAGRPIAFLIAGGTEPASPQERMRPIWQRIADREGVVMQSIAPYGNDPLDVQGTPLDVEPGQ